MVFQHGGEKGTQLPMRERVSTVRSTGAQALLQAWPRLPGLAKASPCHLCPSGMISSPKEVSKDSKQTRRPPAGLSELLPHHAHRTRTRTHAGGHAHAHITQSPALAGRRGGSAQHLAAAPTHSSPRPQRTSVGRKSRQKTNKPASERLAFSRVKFWPLNDFPAWPG